MIRTLEQAERDLEATRGQLAEATRLLRLVRGTFFEWNTHDVLHAQADALDAFLAGLETTPAAAGPLVAPTEPTK